MKQNEEKSVTGTVSLSSLIALIALSLFLIPASVMPGFSQEGKQCQHHGESEKKEKAAHACTLSDAEKEMLKEAKKVTMTGQILCAMCNLKSGKTCQSMFKDEASNQVYSLVDNESFHKITSITKHGEKKVTVTGNAASSADKNLLEIESFEIQS